MNSYSELIEMMAKAFCEASGIYKWEDTQGSVREWYLKGAQAAYSVVESIMKEFFE